MTTDSAGGAAAFPSLTRCTPQKPVFREGGGTATGRHGHVPPPTPRDHQKPPWAACRGYRPWARQASNTALAKRSMLSRDRQSMSGGLASNVFRTFTSSRLNVTVMVFSACLARYFAWRSAWVMAVPVRGRPRGRLMGSRSAVW